MQKSLRGGGGAPQHPLSKGWVCESGDKIMSVPIYPVGQKINGINTKYNITFSKKSLNIAVRSSYPTASDNLVWGRVFPLHDGGPDSQEPQQHTTVPISQTCRCAIQTFFP